MDLLRSGLRSSLVKLIVLALFASPTVIAQRQDKMIEWSPHPISSHHVRTAPNDHAFDQINGIEIRDIMVNGQSITIGQPFPAGDDWLEGITFRIKNVSGQRLTAIQLDLVLPEMSPTVAIPFVYGNPTKKDTSILPGEEVELRIPGSIYGWAKDRITEKGSLSRISKAQIREMLVSLPDGSRWFSGCIKTTNPKNGCPVSSP